MPESGQGFCSAHQTTLDSIHSAVSALTTARLDLTALRTTVRNTAVGAGVVWAIIVVLGGAYVKSTIGSLETTVNRVTEMSLRDIRQEMNIDNLKEWKLAREKWQAHVDRMLSKLAVKVGIEEQP